MNKNLTTFYALLTFLISGYGFSQVGISKTNNFTPDAATILDVSSSDKGILIPRVELTSAVSLLPITTTGNTPNSLLVYNTAIAGTKPNNVTPGFYYWEGDKWVRMINKENEAKPAVFYAPSLALETKASITEYTVDLYEEYLKQYTLSDANTSIKSDATASLPTYDRTDLYYFITYYDNSVFKSVNVDSNGVLKYTIDSAGENAVSEKTYMNVVFKVKN